MKHTSLAENSDCTQGVMRDYFLQGLVGLPAHINFTYHLTIFSFRPQAKFVKQTKHCFLPTTPLFHQFKFSKQRV